MNQDFWDEEEAEEEAYAFQKTGYHSFDSPQGKLDRIAALLDDQYELIELPDAILEVLDS